MVLKGAEKVKTKKNTGDRRPEDRASEISKRTAGMLEGWQEEDTRLRPKGFAVATFAKRMLVEAGGAEPLDAK